MHIAIPTEVHPGERRVSATPQSVMRLKKLGLGVRVQAGAGCGANFTDAEYAEAGAEIIPDARTLWSDADVVLTVRPPTEAQAGLLKEGAWLVGFIWPAQNQALVDRLAARKATVLAMDRVPRITRAQKCDALSATANLAGYRAVIEAAAHLPRFFSGQMTAAGKIDPAKVLVIGAGVAGLAAIGAARGLGAVVRAFDARPATRDQVKSLGAEFLEVHIDESGEGAGGYAKEMSPAFIEAEMALFAAQAMDVDIIITTALIPGKKAPKLITAGMVESMKPGSVIVDLAAEQGGNCALTKPGDVIVHKGVTIIGHTDLPSRMPAQASQLYASTIAALLEEALRDGRPVVDPANDITSVAAVLVHGAAPAPPAPKPVPAPAAPATPVDHESTPAAHAKPEPVTHAKPAPSAFPMRTIVWLAVAGLLMALIGWAAPSSFIQHFTVFILACFVGWQVVWNVKPALHTPLMSVTNAISGIILIGGMLHLGGKVSSLTVILGAAAVFLAMINVAGGFLVTGRMLAMFRR
ncbi:MAG: NAD(P) transhydrogenase subunit alpha [Phycisphaerae bacterium]|nr:MAG: NAD(P) transhydrogenase subunit alpha [Phycisphaerae bacterium]